MKKYLLATSALVFFAAPAQAEVKLGLGGYFSGYGVFSDNDIADQRDFDLRRNTEVHFSGETTLDNGLTVGFHTEQALGGETITDEAYAYFSGAWGRVNLGSEDGVAYLLQVAAPSADSNIDGMKPYIQAIDSDAQIASLGISSLSISVFGPNLSYAHIPYVDQTNAYYGGTFLYGEKLLPNTVTYLSPKIGGFHAGISFTPTLNDSDVGDALSPMDDTDVLLGHDNLWQVAARWDGQIGATAIALGAGYSDDSLQQEFSLPLGSSASGGLITPIDGTQEWNLGAHAGWNGWSLGLSWLHGQTVQKNGIDRGSTNDQIDFIDHIDLDKDVYVAGLGWDHGPWHMGASAFRGKFSRDASGVFGVDDGATREVDAKVNRYTVGGGYAFGPGMSLRAALAWGMFDNDTPSALNGTAVGKTDPLNMTGSSATNNNFTQVTIGTQINF